MRQLLAAFLMGCIPQAVIAQTDTAERLRALVADMLPSLESMFECDISIHGDPRLDEISNKWLVAYSASGDDCDEASQALQHQAAPLEIVFFRRPTLGQVRGLIAEIRRSVEAAFGCHITLRGDPRFDEASSHWSAAYLAAGSGCDEASEELRRRGSELQIFFVPMPSRQDLIR